MTDKGMNELDNNYGDEMSIDQSIESEIQSRIDAGGKEVFAPTNQPFEAPNKTIESGPLYIDADEIMKEISPETEEEVKQANQQALDNKMNVDRRDFLRLFGSSAVLGTGAAACVRRPEEPAIPYANQPKDQVPGRETLYATTCGECTAGCGVVASTREGRPVKLEGNNANAISHGNLCALGQASIQGLYHPERRKSPAKNTNGKFADLSWDDAYKAIAKEIGGKRVAILTGGSTGNSQEFYRHFLKKVGSSEDNLYTYESNSLLSSISQAHKIAFGVEGMPRADLRKANTIVGIGSDILDVGIQPVYYQSGFSFSQFFSAHGSKGDFIQFESTQTLTGAKASERHVIPPGSETLTALYLADVLYSLEGSKGTAVEKSRIKKVLDAHQNEIVTAPDRLGVSRDQMKAVAEKLLSSTSLVVAGGSSNFDVNSTSLQLAATMVNVLIGAYGRTLEMSKAWLNSPVKPGDMKRFLNEANNIDTLIIINTNPGFTLPKSQGFDAALAKINTVVSIQPFPNETDLMSDYALPGHHYLESWGDEQPVAGYWCFRQPVVRSAYNSVQAEDILMWLAAHSNAPLGYKDYKTYLKEKWTELYKKLNVQLEAYKFENGILRKGVFGRPDDRTVGELKEFASDFTYTPFRNGMVLMAPLDVRLRDGRGAHLPVLQEAGDSMTTIAWDSFILMNPGTAKRMGLRRNELIKVSTDTGNLSVALFPMPGMHPNAVVIPRGNGKAKGLSKITDGNGVDPLQLFPAVTDPQTGDAATAGINVKVAGTGEKYVLAAMQKKNDIANRTDIVRKVDIETAKKSMRNKKDLDKVPDLYPALKQGEYRWGMSIDLDRCTGCSACMVACSLENNVPQVGRDQILMGREMHWIRLDRYFAGSLDNPDITFQPVMCQQCNHAPCEGVCPVYATTHDEEGINAMTYNRCVGTRYCANACPYKVRRFNWWTHKWGVIGEKARDRNPRALNPDVTVRTRGVMEKCNFCFQRIRAKKHEYKYLRNGARVRDGHIQTACQQTCPSNAIVFGDLSKNNTMASRMRSDSRAYLALGGHPEIGEYGIKTLPNVSYLAKVTKGKSEDSGDHHG